MLIFDRTLPAPMHPVASRDSFRVSIRGHGHISSWHFALHFWPVYLSDKYAVENAGGDPF